MRATRPSIDPNVPLAASLLADRSRMTILLALSDGRALPAGELARAASIAAPTASGHLAQLTSSGVVIVVQQGRHRYYRLAGDPVGAAIEALACLAPNAAALTARQATMARDLRAARLCFGHLAGALGVGLGRALIEEGVLLWSDAGFCVSTQGWQWLAGLGVDAKAVQARRPSIRTCHVDWSERRPHLGGPFGVALTRWLVDDGCIVRIRESRAVRVTARGAKWFGALRKPACP
jgi:DNA-binding transcriptional ArsR family regulator